MKKALLLIGALFSLATAFAQHGIMPGEPDPNTGPGRDTVVDKPGNEKDVTKGDLALVDDRAKCPKGQKRFQVYHCEDEKKAEKECDNYQPVFECGAKPKKVTCTKPQVQKPVYQCVGS